MGLSCCHRRRSGAEHEILDPVGNRCARGSGGDGFFVIGWVDHSVSAFNLLLWIGLLAVLGGVLGGSLLLRSVGHPTAPSALLLALAIPAFLVGSFFLLLIVLKPKWN
jgi:hypothetical protein